MPVTVESRRSGDECRCVVAGELDLATEKRVRRAFADALAERPRTLVVDLGGVTFVDSTGLRCLLSARNHAASIGARVVLANVTHPVAHTLAIANLVSFFDYEMNAGRN